MANENIGGVNVNITGDLSDLKKSFGQAQAASKEAGENIGNAFREGAKGAGSAADSVNNLGQAATKAGFSFRYAFFGVKDLMEGRVKFAVAEAANELVRMGGAALGAGIAIGSVAAAGYAIYRIHEYVVGLREATQAAAGPFRELNAQLQLGNDRLQVTNDRLANEIAKLEGKPQNNLKLALDEAIASADALALALAKDNRALSELLEKHEVGKVHGWFTNQLPSSGIREQLTGVSGFGGMEAERNAVMDRGAAAIRAATTAKEKDAAQTRMNAELTALYARNIDELNKRLAEAQQRAAQPSGIGSMPATLGALLGGALGGPPGQAVGTALGAAQRPNATTDVEQIRAAIRNLQEEQRRIPLASENANLQGRKDELTAAKEQARAATEALKKADEDELAEEKSRHEMSVGMLMSFWRRKLEIEQSNADRAREIRITLGNLAQEQDKMFHRIMERGTKLQEEQINKARKFASELEVLQEEGDRLGEKIGQEVADRARKLAEIRIKSESGAGAAAGEIAKLQAQRDYQLGLDHSLRAQLLQAQRIAAADRQANAAKIAGLERIAAAEDDEIKKAEANLALEKEIESAARQEFEDRTKILEIQQQMNGLLQFARGFRDTLNRNDQALAGNLGAAVGNLPKNIGDGIGQSFATALLTRHPGRSMGQEFAHEIVGAMKNIAGTIIKDVIGAGIQVALSRVLSSLGAVAANATLAAALAANTAAVAAGAGAMTVVLGANTVASAVNTAALAANTAALAASATANAAGGGGGLLGALGAVLPFLMFADGGQPPVGRPSIVGERGAELFVPREAGTIVPNHALRGISAPGLPAQTYSSSASYSGSQTNNFTITGATNPREVARSVAEYLKSTAPGFSPWNSRA